MQELEYYVTSEGHNISYLLEALVNTFPQFHYEGVAFRALRGEWIEEGFHNFSWSLDFESAVEACESFSALSGDIFVYEAQIKGFDLDLFVRQVMEKEVHTFSPNFLSFALKEKEILSYQQSGRVLSQKINKIF